MSSTGQHQSRKHIRAPFFNCYLLAAFIESLAKEVRFLSSKTTSKFLCSLGEAVCCFGGDTGGESGAAAAAGGGGGGEAEEMDMDLEGVLDCNEAESFAISSSFSFLSSSFFLSAAHFLKINTTFNKITNVRIPPIHPKNDLLIIVYPISFQVKILPV